MHTTEMTVKAVVEVSTMGKTNVNSAVMMATRAVLSKNLRIRT